MGCAHPGVAADAAEHQEVVEKHPTRDFHEKYMLLDRLGAGGFGVVYSAIQVDTDTDSPPVAVKVIDLRQDALRDSAIQGVVGISETDIARKRAARAEVTTMQALQGCERVCHAHDIFIDGCLAYIVLEKCEMSLYHALDRLPLLSEAAVRPFIKGMLRGISFVHARLIVHRDIKPANFMYSGNTVKLCDFGLARRVRTVGDIFRGPCGTPAYMAPEMLLDLPYGQKIDIWALGVSLYAICYGRFPFAAKHTVAAMTEAVGTGGAEPVFHQEECVISVPFTLWLRKLMFRDANIRPTAVDAINECPRHPGLRFNLRSRLESARRCGAFGEVSDKGRLGVVDKRLRELQRRHHAPSKESHHPSEAPTDLPDSTPSPAGDTGASNEIAAPAAAAGAGQETTVSQ